ncbi:MAG: transcriptional regulator PpsR [Alphaproteobacteria bacterium]|nr:transcriptional regulator PpsR [Alphaproteobacteria bacterium]
MLDPRDSLELSLGFNNPEQSPGPLDAAAASQLASQAGELVLVLDPDGTILDVAAGRRELGEVRQWIGRAWVDTVTVESRPKVEEMLSGSRRSGWRQINHQLGDSGLPMRYRLLSLGSGGFLAIGRDLSATAALQQRLLQVQQSLERDHMRLRQAEARYRMLFDRSGEAMVIAEAGSGRVREINPPAAALVGALPSSAKAVTGLFAAEDRDTIVAFLGAVTAGALVVPLRVRLAGDGREVTVTASAFRQEGASFHLLRIGDGSRRGAPDTDQRLLDMLEQMPDAFVVTDAELRIVSANTAFAELAQATSMAQLRGRQLAELLGRPGIDLDLILGQLAEHPTVRNVATILFGVDGGQEEVEVSAARGGSGGEGFGFCIRPVGRRLRDLPPVERDLPRSVEQLTELVGRMPLKSIVRESTDLIERLCIEAALAYTSDNRASAAEILGLSRQSLYSKLHRHGLGNLSGAED